MTPRDIATDVVRRLQEAGFIAYFAGGCVRDEQLGLTPVDYDVATNARPEQVQKLFARTIAIGAAFGVIDVIGPRIDGVHANVQVATFRSDGTYSDGRRPDSVTFGTPEADAERRDFTVNGMFFDPIANRLIDFVNGLTDLERKVLRAIGDPAARFAEDKLRILRAVRMATRFELTIDPATFAAGRQMAPQIRAVSAERIAEEFRKLFAHRHRRRGAELLAEFGLLTPILPELHDAADPSILGQLPPDASFPIAFAAYLLPVGRKTAEAISRRLRLSNDEIDAIGFLVGHQSALIEARSQKKSTLYPLLVHPRIHDLIALHEAIAKARQADMDHVRFCRKVLSETPVSVLNPVPLLTGDDLIRQGFTSGPHFRIALDTVRVGQLDDLIRDFDEALAVAARIISRKANSAN
jgi:poly(A) polymerase